MRLVVDIEANRLEDPDTIWCIVAKDVDTGTVYPFVGPCYDTFIELVGKADEIIGHNFLGYDAPVLNKLLGNCIDTSKVTDTLVLSHLFDYRREGGHSLDAWGQSLGFHKIKFNEFEKFSEEMLTYCVRDVELNHKVYDYLMVPRRLGHPTFSRSISTEMEMARICQAMHESGFAFNEKGARALLDSLEVEVASLDAELLSAFPPKAKLIRVVTPKLTKKGTISKSGISNWYESEDYTIFSPECSFSLVEWVPFNPSSPRQIIDRLWEAGWAPEDKTNGFKDAEKEHKDTTKFQRYGWKVNERNLATLPDSAPPAARKLVERLMLGARVRTLTEWLSFYNPSTGRVHSRFNGIGTWTHRLSSKAPNLQNIAAQKSIKYNSPRLKDRATELGGLMRSLWTCPEGSYLVGTDMESAHLRIFAHLINDEKFIKALLSGSKDDGTDPHSLNKRILGDVCADRDRAKTFIFSFLNGAGVGKVGEIFGCSRGEAAQALDKFIEAYPGLKRFREETAPRDADRGYFISLDGRAVKCDSAHHMLAGYMQNYEKIIMAEANILWRKALRARGVNFRQVNLVHDEWQTEIKGSLADAVFAGRCQAASLAVIGHRYKLNCPMAGSCSVGENWLETH